jgi:hypothetical protein
VWIIIDHLVTKLRKDTIQDRFICATIFFTVQICEHGSHPLPPPSLPQHQDPLGPQECPGSEVKILQKCPGSEVGILQICQGTDVGILHECPGTDVRILQKCPGPEVGILQECPGLEVGILQECPDSHGGILEKQRKEYWINVLFQNEYWRNTAKRSELKVGILLKYPFSMKEWC